MHHEKSLLKLSPIIESEFTTSYQVVLPWVFRKIVISTFKQSRPGAIQVCTPGSWMVSCGGEIAARDLSTQLEAESFVQWLIAQAFSDDHPWTFSPEEQSYFKQKLELPITDHGQALWMVLPKQDWRVLPKQEIKSVGGAPLRPIIESEFTTSYQVVLPWMFRKIVISTFKQSRPGETQTFTRGSWVVFCGGEIAARDLSTQLEVQSFVQWLIAQAFIGLRRWTFSTEEKNYFKKKVEIPIPYLLQEKRDPRSP